MPGFEKVRKNLEAHGFDVTCFDGSRATPWCAATGWETASQTQPPPRSI